MEAKGEDIERAVPFVTRYLEHVMPVMIHPENNVVIGAAFVEAAKKACIKSLHVVRQAFADPIERKLFRRPPD